LLRKKRTSCSELVKRYKEGRARRMLRKHKPRSRDILKSRSSRTINRRRRKGRGALKGTFKKFPFEIWGRRGGGIVIIANVEEGQGGSLPRTRTQEPNGREDRESGLNDRGIRDGERNCLDQGCDKKEFVG